MTQIVFTDTYIKSLIDFLEELDDELDSFGHSHLHYKRRKLRLTIIELKDRFGKEPE